MFFGLYLHPLVKGAPRIVSEVPTRMFFTHCLPADYPLLYLNNFYLFMIYLDYSSQVYLALGVPSIQWSSQ